MVSDSKVECSVSTLKEKILGQMSKIMISRRGLITKKITDFLSHVTKDESMDSLARSLAHRSELEKLERLELLEKRLKEIESTEARLIQENQQLQSEKEQKSRKSEKKISNSNTNNK